MKQKRLAFLDRDGTIIVEHGHLTDPRRVELLAGAAEGINRLKRLGYLPVVITNQSVVGRGLCTFEDVLAVNRKMISDLAEVGAYVDGVFMCPHHPKAGCSCRKPRAGLFYEAASALGVGLENSVVIGDKLSDLEAGRLIGARCILVRTGYGAKEETKLQSQADWVVDTLAQAAERLERMDHAGF